MFFSGERVKAVSDILKNNGAQVATGTEAQVISVASSQYPVVYLCETLPVEGLELEEFFCFHDEIESIESRCSRCKGLMYEQSDYDKLREERVRRCHLCGHREYLSKVKHNEEVES